MSDNGKVPNSRYFSGDEKLKKHLLEEIPKRENENLKETGIHADPRGIPTVGYGIALGKIAKKATIEKGAPRTIKVIELHPLHLVNKLLRYADPKIELTGAQYKNIQDAIISNKGGIPTQGELDENLRIHNGFITLDEKQAMEQLDVVLTQRMTSAEAAARKVGVLFDRTDKPTSYSMEEKALMVDLYFRGGTNLIFGQWEDSNGNKHDYKINKAIREGDKIGLLREAVYGSNGDELGGNDTRMAELAAPIFEQLTDEEKTQFYTRVYNEVPAKRFEDIEGRGNKNFELKGVKFFDRNAIREKAEPEGIKDTVAAEKAARQKNNQGDGMVHVSIYKTPNAAEGSDGMTDAHYRAKPSR